MSPDHPRIILYSRPGCHLCEEMLAAVEALLGGCGPEVTVRDIDADPELAIRYGNRIPVLCVDGEPVCVTRLVPEQVVPAIARLLEGGDSDRSQPL